MHNTRLHLLAAATVVCPLVSARADWVVLKDGTKYQGTIVDSSGTHVVADVMDGGRRATKAFKKSEVKEVIKEPLPEGFFGKPKAPDMPAPSAGGEDDAAPVSTGKGPYYIEIPLVGTFGEDFDETGVEEALAAAKKRRVEHVLFTLESPGGRVSTATAIQELLQKYDADFTYHVHVKEALSASLWVLVCADRIFFHDGANAGAAVAFKTNVQSGAAQVDAKITAAITSRLASLAETKKKLPPLLVRAMVDDEVAVYVHREKGGHSTIAEAIPKDADPAEWTELDSKTQVLALSKEQALQLGFGEDWNTRDVLGDDWKLASKIGEMAMKRSRERVHDFAKASELGEELLSSVRRANAARTAEQFDDYTYETITSRDRAGNIVSERRLTPASRARWDQRNAAVVAAWEGVRDNSKAVLAVLKKHERTGLPEDQKKLKEYAAECEAAAGRVLK